jgi:hypothetical protein
MKTVGTVGAAIFFVAYTLLVVIYFTRFMNRYRGDLGIRFGSITVIVLFCMMAIYRLPEFEKIQDWAIPVFFITEIPLVCLSLFYIVKETVKDFRKSDEKKHDS